MPNRAYIFGGFGFCVTLEKNSKKLVKCQNTKTKYQSSGTQFPAVKEGRMSPNLASCSLSLYILVKTSAICPYEKWLTLHGVERRKVPRNTGSSLSVAVKFM